MENLWNDEYLEKFALEYIKHNPLYNKGLRDLMPKEKLKKLRSQSSMAMVKSLNWKIFKEMEFHYIIKSFEKYYAAKLKRLCWAARRQLGDPNLALLLAPPWLRTAEAVLHRMPVISPQESSKQGSVSVSEQRASWASNVSGLMERLAVLMAMEARERRSVDKELCTDLRLPPNLALDKDLLRWLWEQMKEVSGRKLRVLACVGDSSVAVSGPAAMAPHDWLVADALMLYSNFQLVNEESHQLYPQLQPLIHIFHLVQKYNLEENDHPVLLASRWKSAYSDYIQGGNSASLVMLQRRWCELKQFARRRLLAQWAGKGPESKPCPIHLAIARRFSHIVTQPLPTWSELVNNGSVILEPINPEMPSLEDNHSEVPTANYEIGPVEHVEAEDDLILIERYIETVDVEDEDDHQDTDAAVHSDIPNDDNVNTDGADAVSDNENGNLVIDEPLNETEMKTDISNENKSDTVPKIEVAVEEEALKDQEGDDILKSNSMNKADDNIEIKAQELGVSNSDSMETNSCLVDSVTNVTEKANLINDNSKTTAENIISDMRNDESVYEIPLTEECEKNDHDTAAASTNKETNEIKSNSNENLPKIKIEIDTDNIPLDNNNRTNYTQYVFSQLEMQISQQIDELDKEEEEEDKAIISKLKHLDPDKVQAEIFYSDTDDEAGKDIGPVPSCNWARDAENPIDQQHLKHANDVVKADQLAEASENTKGGPKVNIGNDEVKVETIEISKDVIPSTRSRLRFDDDDDDDDKKLFTSSCGNQNESSNEDDLSLAEIKNKKEKLTAVASNTTTDADDDKAKENGDKEGGMTDNGDVSVQMKVVTMQDIGEIAKDDCSVMEEYQNVLVKGQREIGVDESSDLREIIPSLRHRIKYEMEEEISFAFSGAIPDFKSTTPGYCKLRRCSKETNVNFSDDREPQRRSSTDETSEKQESEDAKAKRVAKRVELPNIEEIRRINRNMLTAQVTPITLEDKDNDDDQVTDTFDDSNTIEITQSINPVVKGNEPRVSKYEALPNEVELNDLLEELSRAQASSESGPVAGVSGGGAGWGAARTYCCRARRHRAVNDARRRLAAKAGHQRVPAIVSIHRHSQDDPCECCCLHLVQELSLEEEVTQQAQALRKGLARALLDTSYKLWETEVTGQKEQPKKVTVQKEQPKKSKSSKGKKNGKSRTSKEKHTVKSLWEDSSTTDYESDDDYVPEDEATTDQAKTITSSRVNLNEEPKRVTRNTSRKRKRIRKSATAQSSESVEKIDNDKSGYEEWIRQRNLASVYFDILPRKDIAKKNQLNKTKSTTQSSEKTTSERNEINDTTLKVRNELNLNDNMVDSTSGKLEISSDDNNKDTTTGGGSSEISQAVSNITSLIKSTVYSNNPNNLSNTENRDQIDHSTEQVAPIHTIDINSDYSNGYEDLMAMEQFDESIDTDEQVIADNANHAIDNNEQKLNVDDIKNTVDIGESMDKDDFKESDDVHDQVMNATSNDKSLKPDGVPSCDSDLSVKKEEVDTETDVKNVNIYDECTDIKENILDLKGLICPNSVHTPEPANQDEAETYIDQVNIKQNDSLGNILISDVSTVEDIPRDANEDSTAPTACNSVVNSCVNIENNPTAVSADSQIITQQATIATDDLKSNSVHSLVADNDSTETSGLVTSNTRVLRKRKAPSQLGTAGAVANEASTVTIDNKTLAVLHGAIPSVQLRPRSVTSAKTLPFQLKTSKIGSKFIISPVSNFNRNRSLRTVSVSTKDAVTKLRSKIVRGVALKASNPTQAGGKKDATPVEAGVTGGPSDTSETSKKDAIVKKLLLALEVAEKKLEFIKGDNNIKVTIALNGDYSKVSIENTAIKRKLVDVIQLGPTKKTRNVTRDDDSDVEIVEAVEEDEKQKTKHDAVKTPTLVQNSTLIQTPTLLQNPTLIQTPTAAQTSSVVHNPTLVLQAGTLIPTSVVVQSPTLSQTSTLVQTADVAQTPIVVQTPSGILVPTYVTKSPVHQKHDVGQIIHKTIKSPATEKRSLLRSAHESDYNLESMSMECFLKNKDPSMLQVMCLNEEQLPAITSNYIFFTEVQYPVKNAIYCNIDKWSNVRKLEFGTPPPSNGDRGGPPLEHILFDGKVPDKLTLGDKHYRKMRDSPLIFAQVYSMLTDAREYRNLLFEGRTLWAYSKASGAMNPIKTAAVGQNNVGLMCEDIKAVEELVATLNFVEKYFPFDKTSINYTRNVHKFVSHPNTEPYVMKSITCASGSPRTRSTSGIANVTSTRTSAIANPGNIAPGLVNTGNVQSTKTTDNGMVIVLDSDEE